MARTYDVIERLKRRNEKPVIILDEEHKFPINTKKTNVLCMMACIKKQEKSEDPEADIKMTDKIIEMALGKEAAEYIDEQDYSFAVISDIIDIIMAAIADEEATYQKEEKNQKK